MAGTDLTRLAVQRQADAMGCELFELGLLDPQGGPLDEKTGEPEGRMQLRRWTRATLLQPATVSHLRARNLQGHHVYIRPAGAHGLALIDDLSAAAVDRMRREGFQPAALVETSPGNFQAWLKHGQTLTTEESTAAARLLAERFEADLNSADWRHFGRLAGFTNRKPRYADAGTGLFPFVKLREYRGGVYDRAEELIQQARQGLAEQLKADQERREAWQASAATAPDSRLLKSVGEFRADPRYQGDNTRADLAYATYAVARGATEADVAAALSTRDLSHKGSARRQQDYIDRTIAKALARIRGHDLGR